eukprot:428651_1
MALFLERFKKINQLHKDVVCGYIRNAQLLLPLNNPYYNIPRIVNVLCSLYSMIYDEWDQNCKGTHYIIKDNILTQTKLNCDETAFMKQIINNKGKYKWKFKLINH